MALCSGISFPDDQPDDLHLLGTNQGLRLGRGQRQAIEFVESVKAIYKGEGGYNEDHEYFGELANI